MTESGDIGPRADLNEGRLASLNHPVRSAIILRLAARPASVGELAADIGEPSSKVRYHVRKLVDAKIIEVAGRRSTRGTAETLYRPAVQLIIDDDEFRKLSVLERMRFAASFIRLAFGEVSRSLTSGSFDARLDSTAVHLRIFVDQQGWDEMSALHRETLEQTERIKAAADERLRARGEDGVLAASTQLFYELPSSDRSG